MLRCAVCAVLCGAGWAGCGLQAELTPDAMEQMRRSTPQWMEHDAIIAGAVGATVWAFEIAGPAKDAAERRAARFGALVSDDPATAAPFRELGLTG